jgi:hypothetical protein
MTAGPEILAALTTPAGIQLELTAPVVPSLADT